MNLHSSFIHQVFSLSEWRKLHNSTPEQEETLKWVNELYTWCFRIISREFEHDGLLCKQSLFQKRFFLSSVKVPISALKSKLKVWKGSKWNLWIYTTSSWGTKSVSFILIPETIGLIPGNCGFSVNIWWISEKIKDKISGKICILMHILLHLMPKSQWLKFYFFNL